MVTSRRDRATLGGRPVTKSYLMLNGGCSYYCSCPYCSYFCRHVQTAASLSDMARLMDSLLRMMSQ